MIVTMTTDFGLQDYYVPVIKGAVLGRNPGLQIVDISHNIPHYDIVQAAFVLKNAYAHFPEGTIHLLTVTNLDVPLDRYLAIRHGQHFFIGPDNGVFSLVFDGMPEEVVSLEAPQEGVFPWPKVFSEAVGRLAAGEPLTELGPPVEDIVQRISLQAVTGSSRIRGSVIHIDHFDNVVVNISRELFDRVRNERDFSLYFKRHDPITQLSEHYYDVAVGETLCLFNSAHYLEIAVHMGRAATLHSLKVEDTVEIEFE